MSGAATCSKIFSGPGTPTIQTLDISARTLAAFANSTTYSATTITGDISSCNGVAGATTAALPIGIYFISTPSTQSGFVAWTPTSVDLVGPNPPTNVNLGAVDTYVKLGWDVNTDADVYGYKLFCDPPPGSAPSDASPVPTPTTDAAVCTTPVTGTADAQANLDASADDADLDASDLDADAGPSSAATIDACVSAPFDAGKCGSLLLVPGIVPATDQFQCGSYGRMSTNGIVDNLAIGASISVAIAAYDALGNVGPLSPVVCGQTVAVNGFDKLYHDAGGTGGGGYCSMGHRPGRAGWGAFSLVLFCTWAVRRRRGRVELARGFDTESTK